VVLNTGDKVRTPPGVTPETLDRRAQAAAALEARLSSGGFDEALIRSVLFVALADRTLDERSFAALGAVRRELLHIGIDDFKRIVREQFLLLQWERERAIQALAQVTPNENKADLLRKTRAIVAGEQSLSPGQQQRLDQLEKAVSAAPASLPVGEKDLSKPSSTRPPAAVAV
jgi:hypothetical protein